VIQQLSGINGVIFYSSGIFEVAGVAKATVPYMVVLEKLVNVLMSVISIPLIEIAGRRKLLLIPMMVIAFGFTGLTIFTRLNEEYQTKNTTVAFAMATLSIIFVLIYVIAFAVSLGPLPMRIVSEMFRQEQRPIAMMLSVVFNWVFTLIVGIVWEFIINAIGSYTFLIFVCLIIIIFVIFVYFFVPETKGKTFDEIAIELSVRLSNGRANN